MLFCLPDMSLVLNFFLTLSYSSTWQHFRQSAIIQLPSHSSLNIPGCVHSTCPMSATGSLLVDSHICVGGVLKPISRDGDVAAVSAHLNRLKVGAIDIQIWGVVAFSALPADTQRFRLIANCSFRLSGLFARPSSSRSWMYALCITLNITSSPLV